MPATWRDLANTTALLDDTGPLVARLHRDDPWHRIRDVAATSLTLSQLSCWPVVTQATYLLRRSPNTVRMEQLASCPP